MGKAILLLFICTFISFTFCACPEAISGIQRWSTWNSKPTNVGADVTIGASQVILLDVSPPRLNRIDVRGTLVIDPNVATIDLAVSSLYVRKGGKFYMGSEECPLSNKVTVTLVGQPQPNVDPDGVGTKVIGVLEGGLLEIHGKPRSVWTVLGQTANINATQITLATDVDWEVGDTIILATTDFEKFDATATTSQNEKLIVTGRNGRVVSFATPLKYTHYGKVWTASNGDSIDMRGEVGLHNRNIVIKGDIDPVTSGNAGEEQWGGHVMIRDGGVGRIEYAEVTLMGQRSEFGRYPLHFHNSSSQPNSYLRGNSIHDTFQRCIVVHSTHNLRVQNNFAYRGKGHCYFIEDGNEEQNVFERNLGVNALVGDLLTSDNAPAMFWITNPMNHFYQNVAVGGKFGFWYSMPVHPLALSDHMKDTLLRYKSNGDFIDNKAHSCASGLFVDKGLANAKPGEASVDTSYYPVNWTAHLALAREIGKPIDILSKDQYQLSVLGSRQPATFVNFIAYKNTENGMWGRGSNMWSIKPKLADNVVGCVWPGDANLFQDAVIVGETDNIGTFNQVRNAWYGDEEGRSRPNKDGGFLHQPILGYSSYDAGGGDLVMGINFHNFQDYTFQNAGRNQGLVRKAGAITGITGPNVIYPKNRIYRANFFNVANRFYYREYYPWSTQLSQTDDAMKGIVWVDADGSLLKDTPEAGCGKQIVGPGPQVRTSACVSKPEWGKAYICPANSNAHRHFEIYQATSSPNGNAANQSEFRLTNDLHVRRLSDGNTVDVEGTIRTVSTGVFSIRHSYGSNLITNNAYYVTLGNANTFLSDFYVQLFDVAKGEKLRLAFPIPTGASVTVLTGGYTGAQTNATRVNSYGALAKDSFFVDAAAGIVWVHLEKTEVEYNYYYGVPIPSHVVAFTIKVAGCGVLCNHGAKSVPNGAAPGGATVNLCETSGNSIVGSISTYSTKSADVLNVFDDAPVAPWEMGSTQCNVSSDMAFQGSTSLKCKLGEYGYMAFSRSWASRDTPYPLLATYTHLQLSVRVANGFGPINLLTHIVERDRWDTPYQSIRMGAPDTTNHAGEIDDTRWTTIRIPLDQLMFSGMNAWGLAIQSAFPRPSIIYIDSVQFVSLTQSSYAITGFPVAPRTPGRKGPGPQFTYVDGKPTTGGTSGYTTDSASNGDSGATDGATNGNSGATDGATNGSVGPTNGNASPSNGGASVDALKNSSPATAPVSLVLLALFAFLALNF